jgi:hypothetical protein
MASNDPDFENKAADIIGLYLHPPQHAAVFCVDEKDGNSGSGSARPGVAAVAGASGTTWLRILSPRHSFPLCGAGVKTGKVEAKTAKRHTSAEFIASESVAQPGSVGEGNPHRAGNLSAHQTKAVEEFLQQHPKVRFHFTPTYSSWLNQVELWFAKIQRDVISRGVFTSVADLARKLRKYIEAYAKSAKPFRWTYTDPQKRIRIKEITGTAY